MFQIGIYTIKVYEVANNNWISEISLDFQGPGIEHLVGYFREKDEITATFKAVNKVYELLTKFEVIKWIG